MSCLGPETILFFGRLAYYSRNFGTVTLNTHGCLGIEEGNRGKEFSAENESKVSASPDKCQPETFRF